MSEPEPEEIVPVEESDLVEEDVEDDTSVTGVPGFDARADRTEEPGAADPDDPEFREPD
jgi:hypothetical protein